MSALDDLRIAEKHIEDLHGTLNGLIADNASLRAALAAQSAALASAQEAITAQGLCIMHMDNHHFSTAEIRQAKELAVAALAQLAAALGQPKE